jgi:hypothetical protein
VKSRIGFVGLAALALLALGLGGTTLWTQSAFTANGQGETIFTDKTPCPGLTCGAGVPTDCGCDLTTGTITGTDIDSGTFVLKDQISHNDQFGNGTNICNQSSGTLVITTNSGACAQNEFLRARLQSAEC